MRATLEYHRTRPTATAVPVRRAAEPADTDSARFRAKLRALCATRLHDTPTLTVPRRGHVYVDGGQDRHIYVIETGQVKTLMTTGSGKRCLLSISGAGDALGELGLLASERSDTAVALEPTTLRRIPGDRFLSVLAEEGLLPEYVRHLGERVIEQQKIIVDMVTMECERRLAARLLLLSQQIGTRRGRLVLIRARITQEELAEMVGTTRSRVGLFLKRFREAGLVDMTQGSLVVDDRRLGDYIEGRLPADAQF
ncbi:Crp/Fnr family transcriptional regulator [Streptomyces sp. NPDC017202]|uniref:Crp/Fnr family transcriptional regulator n=1 Tax=Streptomyces sp. NPDC017202 TaxID=3364981 RepID=UPI0037AF0F20